MLNRALRVILVTVVSNLQNDRSCIECDVFYRTRLIAFFCKWTVVVCTVIY